jgi:hypothetical protein
MKHLNRSETTMLMATILDMEYGLNSMQGTHFIINIVTCYLLTRRIISGLRILYLDLLDIHEVEFTVTYNLSNYIT